MLAAHQALITKKPMGRGRSGSALVFLFFSIFVFFFCLVPVFLPLFALVFLFLFGLFCLLLFVPEGGHGANAGDDAWHGLEGVVDFGFGGVTAEAETDGAVGELSGDALS